MGKTLVIGYGNPLRGDDGLGWRAAELLAGRIHDPDVEILACHQLTPEMAEPLSRAERAIFIDAACDNNRGEIAGRALVPERSPLERFTHHLTPEVLLGLARELYGHAPEARMWSVGAASFDFGETLSPEVEAALPALVNLIHTEGTCNEKIEDTRR